MSKRKSPLKQPLRASEAPIVAGGAPRLPAGFAPTRGKRICVVTTEFAGLFKNGGIGTANTGLALSLAEANVPVTVLYASISALPEAEFAAVQEDYRARGIEIELLRKSPLTPKPFRDVRTASFAVYQYLKQQDFGAVYFQDNCGRGFYALAAKRAGCFHDAPPMFVVAHGPHEWVFDLNCLHWSGDGSIVSAYLERASAEFCDGLISPSQYMVDWMRGRGWRMPASVFVEQNIVRVQAANEPIDGDPVTEFVFFGRNELRKGIKLFCDAVDLVVAAVGPAKIDITFLGKCSEVDGLHSGVYLLQRSLGWGVPPRMLWRFDQDEAINYLSRPGVLAVVPSLAENSPCVVLECLQRGVPFLATDSGGTAELIHPDDAPHCLTAPDAASLAAMMIDAHKQGRSPARLRVPQAETERNWRAFHDGGARRSANRPSVAAAAAIDPPSVSILFLMGQTCEHTLLSLRAACDQTYAGCEILIGFAGEPPVALASEVKEAGHVRWLAASDRETLVREAKGRYLLLFDEAGVILARNAVDVLVEAARRTGAEVITALAWRLEGDDAAASDRVYELNRVPVGAGAGLGLLENLYGEPLALIERETIQRIGGFPEGTDASLLFWRFFATAETRGCRLALAPEPLCWRRDPGLAGRTNSAVLIEYRRLLAVFAAQPLESAQYLIERFANPTKRALGRDAVVSHLPTARLHDIAVRISHDPNSKDAIDGFLQICIELGRVEEALIYSLYNGVPGGAQIRWGARDAVFEFDWASPVPWIVEAQFERIFCESQIERIGVFAGDRPLKLERSWGADRRLRLRVAGDGGETSPVRLRFRLPYVYHFMDASHEAAIAVERLTIRAADGGGVAPSLAAISKIQSAPGPVARSDGAQLAAFIDDAIVGAERVRLDQIYRDAPYRHLDLALIEASVGGETWHELKFKFCVNGEARYLEFRERPDWPEAFEDFPGEQRDDFGVLLRMGYDEMGKTASWRRRDQILLQVVLALLPAAVGGLPSSEFSADELWLWRAEVAAFSAPSLLSLRKLGLGLFAERAFV